MIRERLDKLLNRIGLPTGDLAAPSIGAALVNGSGVLLQFLAAYLLARLLGAPGYGVFAYAFSWTQLLASFGILGFDKLLMREVSQAKNRGEGDRIRPFLAQNGIRSTAFLLIAAILGYLASYLPLPPFEDPEVLFAYRCSMFAVPFLGLITLQRAALQGLQGIVRGQFVEKAVRPLVLIVGTLSLVYLLRGMDVQAAVVINLIALVIASLVGFFFIFSSTSPAGGSSSSPGAELLKKTSGTFLVIGWLQILTSKWDIMILGSMGSNEGAGILQIVIRASTLLHFFLNALNAAIAPKLAQWHQENRTERMQISLTRAVRGINAISLPLVVAIFLFPGPILSIFGPSFSEGKDALLIFAGARAYGLLLGPTGYTLMMTGNQSRMMRILLFSNLFHLLLALVLIQLYGIIGAAIAFATSSLLERSWMYFSVRRLIGVDTSVFGKQPS